MATSSASSVAAEAAAVASAAVGSNGGPAAAMADFVGNPVVPNCSQNFVNIGHSTAAAAAIGGAGGFMQHDAFAIQQMLAKGYDGETSTARFGMNGGGGGVGYSFGYSSGLTSEHGGLGSIANGPFMKSAGTAGGDDRSTVAQ
ncbi:hypothetical protein EJB05_53481, partial [Eragrostis curvula]